MTLDDSAVIAQLTADVKTAWSPKEIHLAAPQVPKTAADLPVANIVAEDVAIQIAEGAAAVRDARQDWRYRISVTKARPLSGTLHAAKVTDANALIQLLTANLVRYAGWRRRVTAVEFNEMETLESVEPVYSVAITFTVEIIGNG